MKVLNLYAGIGGNRKLWTDVEVTAIEWNEKIAEAYKDFHPQDTVIVADAHQYLLDHLNEYDFIWSSPPCPTHSKINTFAIPQKLRKLEYPDMKLYEEIILLKHWFKGNWVVENVRPYYPLLISAQIQHRHCIWSNKLIAKFIDKNPKKPHKKSDTKYLREYLGFDTKKYKFKNERQILRNCVIPELGLHIFNEVNNTEDLQRSLL